MKTNLWLLCGAFLAANMSAQQVTNAPPAPTRVPAASSPASSTNAPSSAGKGARKSPGKPVRKAPVAKPPVLEVRTTPLKPGTATVVASNVNVRGQARLLGEVVTKLTKGQQVTVLEEITLKNSGPEEPSAWAKIALPAGVKVWVNGLFIDAADKTVKVPRLNLRGGPGENYSVLGRVEKGFKVNDLEVRGDWIQLEAPEGCYAFMAAQYLSQEEQAAPVVAVTTPIPDPAPSTPVEVPTPGATPPAAAVAEPAPANPVEEPAPTLTPVIEPKPIASTTTDAPVPRAETPATTPATAPTPQPAPTVTPAAAAAPNATGTNAVAEADSEPEPEEAPVPRVVSREGVVRGSVSIQAPTHFELYSPESKRIVNYLYNQSPDLDLSRYKGLRIIVTGEEGIDERWRNTPLLTIQKIQVLE